MTEENATAPLLEVRAVTFLRHDEAVFAPQSFRLRPGELARIEGDNGSGKTTLLRVLAGLLHPGGGELRWRGEPLRRERCDGDILFIGHQLGLKADLSPRENLRFAAGLHGCRAGVDASRALAAVGLRGYEDEPVRRLSAGQRKRAALARLILLPATLWLLDEPYANLDRSGAALVDGMLQAHAAGGGAALLSSHGAAGQGNDAWRSIRLDA